MSNDRVEKKRIRIRAILSKIVGLNEQLDEEMSGERHRNSTAQISLNPQHPQNGEYIMHNRNDSIIVNYVDADGQRYEIEIRRKG